MAEELGATLTTLPHGGHIGNAFPELPQIWKIMEEII
jgi:hypothetical protein